VIYPQEKHKVEIALPDNVSMTQDPDGALVFTYRRGQTQAEHVLDAVRAAGVQINDVQSRDPDLEDVFLDLTRGTD
jgi:ABC-2 type transport system ATP-binding protein